MQRRPLPDSGRFVPPPPAAAAAAAADIVDVAVVVVVDKDHPEQHHRQNLDYLGNHCEGSVVVVLEVAARTHPSRFDSARHSPNTHNAQNLSSPGLLTYTTKFINARHTKEQNLAKSVVKNCIPYTTTSKSITYMPEILRQSPAHTNMSSLSMHNPCTHQYELLEHAQSMHGSTRPNIPCHTHYRLQRTVAVAVGPVAELVGPVRLQQHHRNGTGRAELCPRGRRGVRSAGAARVGEDGWLKCCL